MKAKKMRRVMLNRMEKNEIFVGLFGVLTEILFGNESKFLGGEFIIESSVLINT